MKNILIPIDFRVESLKTLRYALEESPANTSGVILMYSETLSDSISDMMFYNPAKTIAANMNKEFEEGVNIIKNRYESRIQSLHIRLFHGNNRNAFDNVVHAWQVDEIYIPSKYTLRLPANGFDPIPLIRKSGFHYVEIDWDPILNITEPDQLNALFR